MRSMAAVVLATFLALVVVFGRPLLRAKFGLAAGLIDAIQFVCGAMAIYVASREAYRQASSRPLSGIRTPESARRRNIAAAVILSAALAVALFFARLP